LTSARTGLDRIADGDSEAVRLVAGRKVGVLAHAASVDRSLRSAVSVLRQAGARVSALFGPEHGFAGAAQDMVGVGSHDATEVPVYSLYGDDAEDLSPKPEWLRGLDAIVIDLQDPTPSAARASRARHSDKGISPSWGCIPSPCGTG